jgi:hypothetical protein
MLQISALLKFIEKNSNWKELIQKEPYNIIVKEDGDYTLLKYNQLESDFNRKIVNCCRGIILNRQNKIVCFPFYKFFNYGEPQAAHIDWASARVQEKIDGSIIKVWFDTTWHISTNGSIDAFYAPVGESEKSFAELFQNAIPMDFYNRLNKNNTYMFELVSPESRIVVDYKETAVYHIGTRNNITYQEVEEDIGIQKPKQYSFNSLEDIIEGAKALSNNEEGYVVVDKNYNRIKVKSPAYLMAHYLFGKANFTDKRIVEILKTGEEQEVLNYFPEFKNDFDKIKYEINYFVGKIYILYCSLLSITDRTEYVATIKTCNYDKNYFPFFMKLFDNPNTNLKLDLLNLPADKILEILQ